MTTPEAFAEMITHRAIHRFLEIPSSTVRAIRKRVTDHPADRTKWGVSLEKMEEYLEKSGYERVQETKWAG